MSDIYGLFLRTTLLLRVCFAIWHQSGRTFWVGFRGLVTAWTADWLRPGSNRKVIDELDW